MADNEKPMTRAEFVIGSDTAEKTDEVRKHQAELARSGYGIPTHFYSEHPEVAAAQRSGTTEERSGDGGKAAAEIKDAGGPPLNKAVNPVAQNKAGSTKFVGFASDEAEAAANDAGLTDADFDGVKPSSARGYTKADVLEVIADKDAK